MSQYEPYETPVSLPWANTVIASGHGMSDRRHEPAMAPPVLARVPNLEPTAPPSLRVAEPEADDRGLLKWLERVSPRSLGTIATMMLVVGVGGFLLGRASRSESVVRPDAWCPPPPAANAPEAPAWNGGAVTGNDAQTAPERSVPGLGGLLPPAAEPTRSTPSWTQPTASTQDYPPAVDPNAGSMQAFPNRPLPQAPTPYPATPYPDTACPSRTPPTIR